MAKSERLARFASLLLPGDGPTDMLGLGHLGGFRNKLINGRFWIDNRAAAATANGYLIDRWQQSYDGGVTASGSRVTVNIGNSADTALRVIIGGTQNTTMAFGLIRQRIEGVNYIKAGKVTVSFDAWVIGGNRSVAVELQQNFGSGGSESLSVAPQKVAITATPTRYTMTFDLPPTSGKTIGAGNHLIFTMWMTAGSVYDDRTVSLGRQSGEFYFANVQLEEGSVATPIEHRPIAVEQLLCARYFQRLDMSAAGFAAANSGAQAVGHAYYLAEMRIAPTVGVPAGSQTLVNVATVDFLSIGTKALRYRINQGASSGNFQGLIIGATLEAEL